MELVNSNASRKLRTNELDSIPTHKSKYRPTHSESIYIKGNDTPTSPRARRGAIQIADDKRGTTEHSVKYARNANWFQLQKQKHGYVAQQKGGGIRGGVWWLSRASRFNLMKTLHQIDRQLANENEVIFVGLTYDEDGELRTNTTGKEYKRHLELFTKWLERKHPKCFGVWKWELGVERYKKFGHWVGHWHLIVFGISWYELDAMSKIWNKITNGSETHRKIGVDVKRPAEYRMRNREKEYTKGDWASINNYVSANKLTNYMGKNHDQYIDSAKEYCKQQQIGRWWGSFGKKKLKQHINLINIDLDDCAYARILRTMKKQFLADLRKKGDFKGIARAKKYMKCWHQPSIKVQRFGTNATLLKLVEWANNLSINGIPASIRIRELVAEAQRVSPVERAVDEFYERMPQRRKPRRVLDVSNWKLAV